VKKKVAATKMIAAAEMMISVVAFDLKGSFGLDGEAVALAAVTEGPAVGTVADCGEAGCGFGRVGRALAGGVTLG
jgi:hypothetical protein